jgi:hypothetical protein
VEVAVEPTGRRFVGNASRASGTALHGGKILAHGTQVQDSGRSGEIHATPCHVEPIQMISASFTVTKESLDLRSGYEKLLQFLAVLEPMYARNTWHRIPESVDDQKANGWISVSCEDTYSAAWRATLVTTPNGTQDCLADSLRSSPTRPTKPVMPVTDEP